MLIDKYIFFAFLFLFGSCLNVNAGIGGGVEMINVDNGKNWCIGRFSFKMPVAAVMEEQNDLYNSFTIKTLSISAKISDFKNEIKKKEDEYNRSESLIVNKTEEVAYELSKTKIIWGKLAPDSAQLDVFAYVLDRNVLFYIEGSHSPEYEEEGRNDILKLVKTLKMRNNNFIPNEKGFCINNGFIKDNGEVYRYTEQRLIFSFNNAPSVFTTFESISPYEEEIGLINRMSDNLKEEGKFIEVISRLKTLRKGGREINNMKGEEWVVEAPMKGKNGLDIVWGYDGIAKNNMNPSVQVSLTSGNDLKTNSASLTKKETEQLFNNIVGTLKKF